jgi:cytochrome b subunit of formate dehydrogenase
MYRAGIVLGVVIDLVFVVALLAVTGHVVARWHDGSAQNVATVVTGAWLIALLFSAAAPAFAYALHRRNAPPGRIMQILWLPAMLLVTLLFAALIVSPPK